MNSVTTVTQSICVDDLVHDLRTPLNAISIILNLALRAETDEKVQRYMMMILEQCAYISEIANTSLSNPSDIDETDYFDLYELLTQCLAIISPQANATGMEFTVDAVPLPFMIKGKASDLRRVINNLLINAVKYSRDVSQVINANRGVVCEVVP